MRLGRAVWCLEGGAPAELTNESEVSELTLLSELLHTVLCEGKLSTSAASVSPQSCSMTPSCRDQLRVVRRVPYFPELSAVSQSLWFF